MKGQDYEDHNYLGKIFATGNEIPIIYQFGKKICNVMYRGQITSHVRRISFSNDIPSPVTYFEVADVTK